MICLDGWNSESNPKGRCCCNCDAQKPVKAHPWNKNELTNGSITKTIGYGCTGFDDQIVFFDEKHGLCEMHSFKDQ